MLIDVISPFNTQTFNVWLAHKLGLNNSIYLNVLIEINSKALTKNRMFNDRYFWVDRDYIFRRTTFTTSDQLKLDASLISMGILDLSEDKKYLAINFDVLGGLSITNDEDILKSFEKVKKSANKEPKVTFMLRNVKSKINPNYPVQIQRALGDWLESVAAKFGFVNYAMLKTAQQLIEPIIYGDVNKAAEIINICTVNGYKEMQWGINKYEALSKVNVNNSVNTTVTNPVYKNNSLTDDFF